MNEQTTVQPLTLVTLHAAAQVVIAPARNDGDYEGAIVLSVTDRMITTTAGKFNRRSGAEWGTSGAYHYRSIATDYHAGAGALLSWEKAREINARRHLERELYRAGLEVRDRVSKEWRELSLDQLRRIAAILDEGKVREGE